MAKHQNHSQRRVASTMREVHTNIPSTVQRADVSGSRREAMLRAIALNKAREAGAIVPKPKKGSASIRKPKG